MRLLEYKTHLFLIDRSKGTLKRIRLHNGNKCGSMPIGHLISMKSDYETVLNKIKYQEHS